MNYNLIPPSIDIARISLATATRMLLGAALRNYLIERLSIDHFLGLTVDEVKDAKRKRSLAYDLLMIYERGPRYEVIFLASTKAYYRRPEMRINGIRMPDEHFDLLPEIIEEEIVQLHELRGLVTMEEAEKVAEYDDSIARLVDLLRKIGVDVTEEYLDNLLKV